MSFGEGYTVQRSMTLPNGEYECIIRSVEEKQGNYGKYIQITVQARGKKGWTPNMILYNERPVVGTWKQNNTQVTEEDCKRWDRQLTTFFDAFGIEPGNWNYSTWVNKIGWCKVAEQYDKNEPDKKSKKYKELFPFVKVPENVPVAPMQQATAPAPFTPEQEQKIPF